MQDKSYSCFSVSRVFPDRISLAPSSLSHCAVNSHIRDWKSVMYYTLKRRPAFRHDSTEGPWVMRQTYTLGAQPDVHTCSPLPVAAAAESSQANRFRNTDLHKMKTISYLSGRVLLVCLNMVRMCMIIPESVGR